MTKVKLKSLDCNWRNTRPAKVAMRHRDKHKAIGQWLVIGKPRKPDASWKCGTDVVWPVLDAEFFAEHPVDDFPHVCRHMIDAGD